MGMVMKVLHGLDVKHAYDAYVDSSYVPCSDINPGIRCEAQEQPDRVVGQERLTDLDNIEQCLLVHAIVMEFSLLAANRTTW